jgi:hypothetical protein
MDDARARIAMTDDDIVEHFAHLGYRVAIKDIAFTTEQVDDFRQARRRWIHAGHATVDEPGLLILEDAQPQYGQPTRDMIVVSLGGSRAVMGVHIRANAPPLPSGNVLNRYAPTMQWGSAAEPEDVKPPQKPAAKRSFW